VLPQNGQRAGSTPVVGAVFAPPVQQKPVVPEVERMRRGRPPPASQPVAVQAKPNSVPVKVTSGDPFAALDSKANPADELSSRFPTLDEFSLLVDSSSKFDFEQHTAPQVAQPRKDLAQRVTEKLADEAFATPAATVSQRQSIEVPRPKPTSSLVPNVQPPLKSASAPPKPAEMSRASAIISSTPELQAISSQTAQPVYQPTPTRPVMVSTGTNTTPPPERAAPPQFPIHRFPGNDHHRSSSVPRQQETAVSGFLQTESPKLGPSRPSVLSGQRPPSFQLLPGHARHPSSSRPSLEGGRPSMEFLEPMSKTRSMPLGSAKPRPASTHLESNIDYLREREISSRHTISPAQQSPRYADKDLPPAPEPDEEMNITSNVDFLRSMEDNSDAKKKDKGHHFKHHKKSSISSIGSGTKHILAGKFGDVFKRFEGGAAGPDPARTPSPLKELGRRDLTPIAGSEATDGRSDDGQVLEETDDMTPEMRRELERRRLSMEEKRVAAAGAEYRQRVSSRNPGDHTAPIPLPKSIGGVSRAVSIQNKVQSLLEETNRSPVTRTAQGYGPYSDTTQPAPPRSSDGRPVVPRKPMGNSQTGPRTGVPSNPTDGGIQRAATTRAPASTAPPKPMAPPKPTRLNTVSVPRPASPQKPTGMNVSKVRSAPQQQQPREHLVAVEMPGQPALEMSAAERDDYIRDFQKRFPSLTSIEMVERDLGAEGGGARQR
jgi:AP2-associated kinase